MLSDLAYFLMMSHRTDYVDEVSKGNLFTHSLTDNNHEELQGVWPHQPYIWIKLLISNLYNYCQNWIFPNRFQNAGKDGGSFIKCYWSILWALAFSRSSDFGIVEKSLVGSQIFHISFFLRRLQAFLHFTLPFFIILGPVRRIIYGK